MTLRSPAMALLVSAAIYGFSIGLVHSLRYALLNLVKFPLLIGISVTVCAGSHFLWARFAAPELTFSDVRGLVLLVYRDTAVLLASLSTVCVFLALVFEPPTSTRELGEYPLFLGINVVLIAGAGTLALVRQASIALARHRLSASRARALVSGWLALSLLVGSQAAWVLRPFFGNRAVVDDGSFCLGRRPDFRGATSFYEAAYQLVVPP